MKATLALLVAILLAASPLAVAQTPSKSRTTRPATRPAARPAARPVPSPAPAVEPTPTAKKTESAKKDLMTVLKGANGLNTFITLLQKSDMFATVQRGGPFTLLAPSDFAFHNVDKEKMDAIIADKAKLSALMKGLIAPSRQRTVDMMYQKEIKMFDGNARTTSTKDYAVHVEDAKIINKDMEYDAGIVQEIDLVLMPKVMPEPKAPEAAPAPAVESSEVKATEVKKEAKPAAAAKGASKRAPAAAKQQPKPAAGAAAKPAANPAPQPAQAWKPSTPTDMGDQ